MEQIADATVLLATSPWIYAVVFLLTVLDAFFIVVPSETVVVALGALALSTGSPELAVLIPVAALAATIGDSLTFWIGRRVGLRRFAWMRLSGVERVLGWAARSLDERAAAVLLTARFIPFGRIAVNLTAGASGFRYPRFLALTAIAGACWARGSRATRCSPWRYRSPWRSFSASWSTGRRRSLARLGIHGGSDARPRLRVAQRVDRSQ
jgi:membrane-associated protein